MRAWMKTPGHEGHTVIILNELEMLQQIVGGPIECVSWCKELCIICNEEGRLLDLPYNCTIDGVSYVGTILAVGVDGDEFASIGDDAVDYLNKEVKS